MKGILQFDLPEEGQDYQDAIKGGDYKAVLWDLDQFLRNKVKYGDIPEDQEKCFQECRDKLWGLLKDWEVSLD